MFRVLSLTTALLSMLFALTNMMKSDFFFSSIKKTSDDQHIPVQDAHNVPSLRLLIRAGCFVCCFPTVSSCIQAFRTRKWRRWFLVPKRKVSVSGGQAKCCSVPQPGLHLLWRQSRSAFLKKRRRFGPTTTMTTAIATTGRAHILLTLDPHHLHIRHIGHHIRTTMTTTTTTMTTTGTWTVFMGAPFQQGLSYAAVCAALQTTAGKGATATTKYVFSKRLPRGFFGC